MKTHGRTYAGIGVVSIVLIGLVVLIALEDRRGELQQEAWLARDGRVVLLAQEDIRGFVDEMIDAQ